MVGGMAPSSLRTIKVLSRLAADCECANLREGGMISYRSEAVTASMAAVQPMAYALQPCLAISLVEAQVDVK